MAKTEMRKSAERAFQAYRRPLKTVTSFKYLWRVLTVAYKNWSALVGNLKKARKILAQLMRILGQEGANPRVSGVFFKVVVQSVLIFDLKTWVMTPCMGWALGSFQNRVARWITGRQTKTHD